jgi:hypothetical protein
MKKDLSLQKQSSSSSLASSSTPGGGSSSLSVSAHEGRTVLNQLNEYSTLDAMIADLFNNLAACHEVIGEIQDAKKLFEESLQLRRVSE